MQLTHFNKFGYLWKGQPLDWESRKKLFKMGEKAEGADLWGEDQDMGA